MLSVKDRGILLQIVKRCNRIQSKLIDVRKEKFKNDDDIKEVICFNLFQIGELAGGLSNEFTESYNKIPWKLIIGMRHKIVHGYDTINLHIVWNTAKSDITMLKEYCNNILKKQ